ncbi:MAG: glycosyltransferase family 4 protein [Deinococcota bacterium]|nr:glycosyltransferase family 4 protein [Deinococcota bacterium]
MRIAYVSADPGVPVYGSKGCSVHVQEVVRALMGEGAEVVLFTNRVGGETPEDLRGVRVHALPALPKGELAARERAALGANDILRAGLEYEGPFDVIYERYSLWSFAGMAFAGDAGTPGLLEVNAPLIEEQHKHRGLVHASEAEAVARRAFAAAAALLPVSREVGVYLKAFPVALGKVHVVPNGVNLGRFALPRRVTRDTFTVGFVGTLKPWHGVDTLLEAFALLKLELPQARLLVIGEGPERAALMAEVARLGLSDSVRFTGAVAPEDVPRLLAQMDAAAAPYPPLADFYFSPLKVYEYLAAGLPVAASRVGQLGDLLTDGVDGLLYEPGDARALAEALARLGQDASLRERLGQAGRAKVASEHSWQRVARRILSIAEGARGQRAQVHG